MRIVLVHPRMSVMGGGERVSIHSIKEALREGHEVYLATEEFDVEVFEDFFGVQGLFNNVRLLTYPPFKPAIRKAVLYQRLIYHQLRLRNLLRQKRFDLVLNTAEVANQPPGPLPSVQYCYFPEYFSHLESNAVPRLWELYYWPAREFYRVRVNQIDRLLAVSDFTRGLVRRKWGRDSTTLYPPCPIDLYNRLPGRKENLVITVGRIALEKRMELFLELARKLPELSFAIVGSIASEKESHLVKLREVAPPNVTFVISPLRKVKDILGRAKVYVHTALNEHFGITIVEAMAAGCVPVVHNSGGPMEIVSDDVGYRWNSIGEASRQVSTMIENDHLRGEKSKAAVLRANLFGPAPFESGIGEVIRQYE